MSYRGVDRDDALSERAVPDDTTNTCRCEYCKTPFPTTDRLALHQGVEHEAQLTADERAAFEDAYDAEQEALGLFRLKALLALVLVYFGFLMVYGFVT
ncbi:DNA-binding protein [Halomarina oriensis]|uniref:DNA-binding protein n=1 Tax=Halomarina oriensis TaxID=671145 RepID=UPI0018EF09BE|nr:DNA-binding protein [Halomarina oriensis]